MYYKRKSRRRKKERRSRKKRERTRPDLDKLAGATTAAASAAFRYRLPCSQT